MKVLSAPDHIQDKSGDPGILIHGVALKAGKQVLFGLHNYTPSFGASQSWSAWIFLLTW